MNSIKQRAKWLFKPLPSQAWRRCRRKRQREAGRISASNTSCVQNTNE